MDHVNKRICKRLRGHTFLAATAALTLTGTGALTTLGTGFFATAVLRGLGLGLGLAEDSPFAFLAEWEAGVEDLRLPPLNGAEATG
jgi:hypothetical protein